MAACFFRVLQLISVRVLDKASATEAVDSVSIFGQAKPKTIKIGIYSFPARRSAIKRIVKPPPCCVVVRRAGDSLT